MDKYCKDFEKKVAETIKKYKLCNKKEKIIVGLSGGKDSTTILYIMKKLGYNVEGLMINLMISDWSRKHLENMKKFCSSIGVKLNIVNIKEEIGSSICYIRYKIQDKKKLSNCMICGIFKRWLLNKKSRELGGKKLVTGHNLDDEAETLLMNYFKGHPNLSFRLGPKTGMIKDKKFVQRIKPLYFFTNKETKKYSDKMKFPILYSDCPCSVGVFRKDVRAFISNSEKTNPKIRENIVKGFLKDLPKFKKIYKPDTKISYCRICGEPSKKEICKRCELMEIIK